MDKAFPLSNRSGLRAIDSTGQRITLPGGANTNIRISNVGSNPCAIHDGDGTQLAIYPTDSATPNGTGLVLPAGNTEVFALVAGATDIHAICAAGMTTSIILCVGDGL